MILNNQIVHIAAMIVVTSWVHLKKTLESMNNTVLISKAINEAGVLVNIIF